MNRNAVSKASLLVLLALAHGSSALQCRDVYGPTFSAELCPAQEPGVCVSRGGSGVYTPPTMGPDGTVTGSLLFTNQVPGGYLYLRKLVPMVS